MRDRSPSSERSNQGARRAPRAALPLAAAAALLAVASRALAEGPTAPAPPTPVPSPAPVPQPPPAPQGEVPIIVIETPTTNPPAPAPAPPAPAPVPAPLPVSPLPREVEPSDGLRLGVGLGIGAGGTLALDLSNPDPATPATAVRADLLGTPELVLRLHAPLTAWFLLGGGLGFRFWNDEVSDRAGHGRNTTVDFTVLPSARLPLTVATPRVELQLTVPIGLSLTSWNSDQEEATTAYLGVPASLGTGTGWRAGFLVGAHVLFDGSFGGFAELGYLWNGFSYEITVAGVSTDAEARYGQFQLGVGALLAL